MLRTPPANVGRWSNVKCLRKDFPEQQLRGRCKADRTSLPSILYFHARFLLVALLFLTNCAAECGEEVKLSFSRCERGSTKEATLLAATNQDIIHLSFLDKKRSGWTNRCLSCGWHCLRTKPSRCISVPTACYATHKTVWDRSTRGFRNSGDLLRPGPARRCVLLSMPVIVTLSARWSPIYANDCVEPLSTTSVPEKLLIAQMLCLA